MAVSASLSRRVHRSAGSSCRERIAFWISKSVVKESRRGRTRLLPPKRRVSGIGGVIPRPEESLPRAPAPAVPPLWAPARLCPKLNEYAILHSRQNSFAVFDATISGSTP
jgi:hypothetical protein